MKIAQVIVDVPSSATNRLFDYKIPDKFRSILRPGVRVIIPFGPRKISGFVYALTDESSFKSLKHIIDVLDLKPVLTDELLKLGEWLTEETLCFHISAYQAMLPQLLKMNYEKQLVLADPSVELPDSLKKFFKHKDKVSFKTLTKSVTNYQDIQQAISSNAVSINYLVESRETKKYVKYIKRAVSHDELNEAIETLPKNAKRQYDVLTFFQQHPEPIEQRKLMNKLKVSYATIQALVNKHVLTIYEKEMYRNPYEHNTIERSAPLKLTTEQNLAIRPIHEATHAERSDVFLLHGVTGSGKTEIYLQSIAQVIAKGKEAIVLVPEISLTPQMVQRFKSRFGKKVAVLHSALSAGEKYDEWRKVYRREVQVVVGARSAIFAPFTNLGIIIIDEEHEQTYKQEEQPRYHARDVAKWRAKYHNCPVILGSATPSLESYARAKKGVYHLLTLNDRTNQKPMPQVEVVDMRAELHAGNRTMFSRQLTAAIQTRIEKGEQIVLLLNRRGYSTFVMCRDCGHVNECPHCEIALTYHKGTELLKCHYCNYVEKVPNVCPVCESDLIRYFGTGTQRVEEALYQHIEGAKILRMDVDTTRRKGSHERILNKFANQEANILLGTQMIAKGLDFKNVTLVGVLTADTILNLPDFRSAEKTFQLLTQVSGRAGRHTLPGEVIVQTYTPEHYSIQLASEYNFNDFFIEEMLFRRTMQYPPYVFLILITVTHPNDNAAADYTTRIVNGLIKYVQKETTILGPSPSPIAKISNRYRYQCMIKYKREPQMSKIIKRVIEPYEEKILKEKGTIVVDMQPYQLM